MKDGIIVAGGGLAGAACAAALAKAGQPVTVIEREAGPVHKICGEFLSIEAQAYLAELGLDIQALGGAAIWRLRLTRGEKSVETPLPFRGIGISRRKLDEALLRYAEQCGATVLRGRTITRLDVADALRLNLKNGETMAPKTLFLATGKHELRGTPRNAGSRKDLVGFKMYFFLTPNAVAELGGRIELILFRGGYAGMQMIEGGQTNLCLLVDRARLRAAGDKWPALLDDLCRETPRLAHLLDGAKALLEQPLTIFRVPYGFVHRPLTSDPLNLYRLGDQAGVIPSFTGDGMAIALHSVAVATSMFLRGADAAEYHQRLAKDIAGQIGWAQFFYRLACARVTGGLCLPLAKRFPGSLKLVAGLTRVPMRARLRHAQIKRASLKAS
jgi:flavin-dependent dehydrogenase